MRPGFAWECGVRFFLLLLYEYAEYDLITLVRAFGVRMCSQRFVDALGANCDLTERKANTDRRLQELTSELAAEMDRFDGSLSIFLAGSIGRSELGEKSDIDPFLLAGTKIKEEELREIKLVLNGLVNKHGFPDVTEDYFKIYQIDDLLLNTGLSDDDHKNTFTVRMLMLLESMPIYNKDIYLEYRQRIVENYFRDSRGRLSEFKPIFLLNDFLRYWRTLCLNYEKLRNDPDRPWRKKNINLKFARRFTVFSSILPMIAIPVRSIDSFIGICNMTPMERLAYGLDALGDESLLNEFVEVLGNYEMFLKLKEEDEVEMSLDIVKPKITEINDRNKRFLFKVLMHERIAEEYKHFLVM